MTEEGDLKMNQEVTILVAEDDEGHAGLIRKNLDRAGIANGTAHRLRHWYGSKLVSSGTDLRTAQSLLRHSNLNTTAIYVAVADQGRVEAVGRLDPFAGMDAP